MSDRARRTRLAQQVAGSMLAATAAVLVTRSLTRRRFERAHAARFTLGVDGIVRGAEPIALDASPSHAVLLLHGFNDTPQSMAPLAHALHAAGWTVRAPLLPGHGRSLRDMAAMRAVDWVVFADAEYRRLRATHDTVVVCGQSMGGAIAAGLAARYPEMPALVLLAPFIGVPIELQLKFTAAWLPQLVLPYRVSQGGERSIHDPVARAAALGAGVVTARTLRELRRVALAAQASLPLVQAPTLYLQSREDNRISVASALRHFAALGCAEKEQQWLDGCGHIVTVDHHREEVARQTAAWFARWAGAPAAIEE